MKLQASLRAMFVGLLLLVIGGSALAQKSKATISARLEPADARVGEQAQVVVTVKLQPGWHVYSMTQEGGLIKTSLELVGGKALTASGKPVQPTTFKKKHDDVIKADLELFEGEVAFGIPVKVGPGPAGERKASVKVNFQTCDDTTCLLPEEVTVPVTFKVAAGAARADRAKVNNKAPKQPGAKKAEGDKPTTVAAVNPSDKPSPPSEGAAKPGAGVVKDGTAGQLEDAKKKGLLAFLLVAFGAGFLALLTPCVFPMIPITVNFFIKQKSDGASPLAGPVVYCLGIVGTFTGLGLAMSLAFGATGIQRLATNSYLNLGLAVLFVVLALSLFGVFEIAVPQGLIRKTQGGARKGGLVAPLLMAMTFTLTSFTCTVPVVGSLLVASTQGDILYPIMGMLAFSTAFASPFFLLALFPQYLTKMPKSGSWLASVKAVMGFLEIAAALKFLSNADLVWQLGWITRPVFLAIWAGIAIVTSLYLMGWIRLPHDDAGVKVGWPRRAIGVLAAIAGIYCLGGINGKPLPTDLVAFLPPEQYPFKDGGGKAQLAGADGIVWLKNYDEAVAKAKAENKLLFIDFTGVTCTNCRWMEANMFPRPEVAGELRKFITVSLYCDLPTDESRRNQKMLKEIANEVSMPFYVIMGTDGKPIKSFPGLTREPGKFVAFLRDGGIKMAAR